MCDDDAHCAENAYMDAATQLPSRQVFVEEMRRRVLEAGRYGTHLSVMFVELNDFEQLKRQGQETADKGMRFLGEFIRNNLRDADLLARYEQNQFALMMPCTRAANAIMPANRLCATIDEYNNPTFSLIVSIGLVELLPDEDTQSLLDRAQSAVQAAARPDENGVCLHEGDTNQMCPQLSSHPA